MGEAASLDHVLSKAFGTIATVQYLEAGTRLTRVTLQHVLDSESKKGTFVENPFGNGGNDDTWSDSSISEKQQKPSSVPKIPKDNKEDEYGILTSEDEQESLDNFLERDEEELSNGGKEHELHMLDNFLKEDEQYDEEAVPVSWTGVYAGEGAGSGGDSDYEKEEEVENNVHKTEKNKHRITSLQEKVGEHPYKFDPKHAEKEVFPVLADDVSNIQFHDCGLEESTEWLENNPIIYHDEKGIQTERIRSTFSFQGFPVKENISKETLERGRKNTIEQREKQLSARAKLEEQIIQKIIDKVENQVINDFHDAKRILNNNESPETVGMSIEKANKLYDLLRNKVKSAEPAGSINDLNFSEMKRIAYERAKENVRALINERLYQKRSGKQITGSIKQSVEDCVQKSQEP